MKFSKSKKRTLLWLALSVSFSILVYSGYSLYANDAENKVANTN